MNYHMQNWETGITPEGMMHLLGKHRRRKIGYKTYIEVGEPEHQRIRIVYDGEPIFSFAKNYEVSDFLHIQINLGTKRRATAAKRIMLLLPDKCRLFKTGMTESEGRLWFYSDIEGITTKYYPDMWINASTTKVLDPSEL